MFLLLFVLRAIISVAHNRLSRGWTARLVGCLFRWFRCHIVVPVGQCLRFIARETWITELVSIPVNAPVTQLVFLYREFHALHR
jgi:hypothetical protein